MIEDKPGIGNKSFKLGLDKDWFQSEDFLYPKEYTYDFISHLAGGVTEKVSLTESELTQPYLDLLAGNYINEFNKLPKLVKELVLTKLKY